MDIARRLKMRAIAHVILAMSVGCFILGTRITVFAAPINLSIIGLMGIFILQTLTFRAEDIEGYRRVLPYIVFCLGLSAYGASAQFLLHSTAYKFYFSQICLNFSIYLLCSAAVANIINSEKLNYIWIFLIIFYISTINSLIIIIEFNFPPVRNFIENILYQATNSNIDYQNITWRLRGVAAASGASLSIFTVIGIVAGAIAVHMRGLSIFTFMACSFSMLISMITVARTGLYLGGMILIVFTLAQLALNFRAAWCPLLTSLLVPILYFLAAAPNYATIAPWAFELWINLITRGDLSTASTDELIAMFFTIFFSNDPAAPGSTSIQLSGWELIFGIGFFDGDTFYRNDSGYMKTLYSVGIFGAVLIYGLLGYHLVKIAKRLSPAAYVWFTFVITLFLAEVKEPFFYQNYTGRSLALLLVCSYLVRPLRRESASALKSSASINERSIALN